MRDYDAKCPACGKHGFEITKDADDVTVIEGAICMHCGHVLTQKEFTDWAFKVATKMGKEIFDGKLG